MAKSQAARTFSEAIKDAENLMTHFDTLNSKQPPSSLDVLKRAGIVMAMTAWETYVEDSVQEAFFCDHSAYRLCNRRLYERQTQGGNQASPL